MRIEYPGTHYHVTSRGNAKQSLFRSDHDRKSFLNILEQITGLSSMHIALWITIIRNSQLFGHTIRNGQPGIGERKAVNVELQDLTPRSDLYIQLLRIRNDIPIILCTGHSEMISPEKAEKIGIREFLMKPVTRQELASAVRRALDAVRNMIHDYG